MGFRPNQFPGFTLLLAGLALCGIGLWLLLSPAQYRAAARIEINPDAANSNGQVSYDPYFIQTEFEVMQSQAVLGRVIGALNLNAVWGKKYNSGGMLTTNESIAILKRHLQITPVRNTKLIEISFTSGDPDEAAKVANAIATAYQDYRLEQRRRDTLNGIKTLVDEFQKEEVQISVLQTNVNLLREKYNINKEYEADFDNPLITPPRPLMTPTEREERQKEYGKTKLFWDEKGKLNEMMHFHQLLQARIAEEKLNLQNPKTSMVEIVDAAQPPESPASPNRFLGAVLFVLGLFSIAGGWLLLKPSRRPAA